MLNKKVSNTVSFSAKVFANGKTTIPTALKRQLHLNDGENVLYIKKENDFITEQRLEAKKESEE